jgi:hypothetical protein
MLELLNRDARPLTSPWLRRNGSEAGTAAPLQCKFRPILQLRTVGVTSVAVGTAIAGRPPHRSVRAELPHTAPTSDG